MPDLSRKASHEFWQGYGDPSIYRVIAFMEGVETWTADGEPLVEAKLEELGKILGQLGNYALDLQSDFVEATSNLTTARILRILQSLDAAHPGSASKVLVYAEENSYGQNDVCSFFLKRNIAFERLRLLNRVFSKERFELIVKAFESEEL